MKINIKIVFSILIVSSALGLIYNFIVNPDGIPLIREERKLSRATDSSDVSGIEDAFDEPKVIVLKQAYRLFNENVLFIDARDNAEYGIGHIAGAISLPYYNFDEYAYQLKAIPKDKPIVVYCDGKECDLSILLGDKLFDMGYKKVYIFFGGWVDWQLANYPVEGEDE